MNETVNLYELFKTNYMNKYFNNQVGNTNFEFLVKNYLFSILNLRKMNFNLKIEDSGDIAFLNLGINFIFQIDFYKKINFSFIQIYLLKLNSFYMDFLK